MPRRGLSVLLGVLGAAALLLAVVAVTVDRTVVSSEGFADATARALEEPSVRAAVGERVADAVIASEPDLVGARPLIEGAATAVVGSRPFRALLRGAAGDLHRSVLERDSGTVSLVVADTLVLVGDALRAVDPELAAKVPDSVRVALVDFSGGLDDATVADLVQTADDVRAVRLVAFPLAVLLLASAVLLARDRRAALVRVAVAVGATGLVVVALGRVGEAVVRAQAPDDLADAAGAVWGAFAGDLAVFGLALVAIGVVLGAAAAALVTPRPVAPLLRELGTRLATVPARRSARAARAVAFALLGAWAVLAPLGVVRAAVVTSGLLLLYAGVTELLRLSLPARPRTAGRSGVDGTWFVRAGALTAAVVVAVAGGAALASTSYDDPPASAAVTACNGAAALCDRPLARVAFAGTHNSMAAAPDEGWLFAAQDLTIAQQLDRGVRALLIDTHYGVRTSRGVFTLLDEGTKSRAKIEEPLGREFVEAAERLRTRIGFRGDRSGKRVYLCHGYCEVGATLAVDVLRDVRDFLVRHPGEVVVLSLEDGVTPRDMEAVMRDAGLLDKAWTGPVTATAPTLGDMVDAGRRLLVMAEERTGGLPWLHAQFGAVAQETPYAFATPDALAAPASCDLGRGRPRGPLFLLNHWVDTSPSPRPSNARVVNAARFLRERIDRCAAARGGLKPGIVAVDFVGVGDTIAVVDGLNGVPAG